MAGRVKHTTKGAISYKREWDRITRPAAVEFSTEDADALRAEAATKGRLKPKGTCHDCDKPVSGERRFCGPCLNKH